MSKAGQNNQIGIYAQNSVAMSLFLQFLRDQNFSHMVLEPGNSEDFDLFFEENRRVICESKYKKKNLTHSQLKEILESISGRKTIGQKDEILIICKKASENLESHIKHIDTFTGAQEEFKKRGFKPKIIKLLPRVKFWQLSGGLQEDINYALVADLMNFWVPADDIKRFTSDILQNKIFKKSTEGSVYSRIDFNNDVLSFRNEVQERSDYFKLQNESRKQFSLLEKEINKNKGIEWGTGSVSAFSSRWDLMSFAADRLRNRRNLDLKKWDSLWQLNKLNPFSFGIFEIFENNLNTLENKKYVVGYIKVHSKKIRTFYRADSDFFAVNVIKILRKVINHDDQGYLEDAFEIIKDLMSFDANELFYLKNGNGGHDQWEKGEICKLLIEIYKKSDKNLKLKIFNLAVRSFNITEDDGEFNHYAPREVFDLIKEWLDEDFSHRFPKLVKIITGQYERYYQKFGKELKFQGWEHMGGGTAFWGTNYHVADRHFIGFILSPAIRKYYSENPSRGWNFVKKYCVSKTTETSKEKPDFLNRSVYEIVWERYLSEDTKVSEEAFDILKEYVLSRKGIPHKSDLVYQLALNSNAPDSKKWRLVELSTKEYGLPVNPFVEKIVSDLANKGSQQAKTEVKKWFSNKKYYGRFLSDMDTTSTIQKLLDSDVDFAVDLFKSVITSEYRESDKSDHFSSFELANLLNEILRKDYSKGLEVLRLLESKDTLSEDQQAIYCFALFNNRGDSSADDIEFLLKIYRDVLDPMLQGFNDDIKLICQRFSHGGHRSAFVQFAERLAIHKKFEDALRIIAVFVDDPNPYFPGKDPDDIEGKYNEHKNIEEKGEEPHSISTVRGWCGWVLMKCSVLEGRDSIPKVIELTKKLVADENYYVVHMVTFALAQLAAVRLTVLPENRNTLFFNDDKEKALKMAKEVESLAFNLLDRLLSWSPTIQNGLGKSVLHVFDPLRALNEKDGLRLLTSLSKLPNKIIDEAAPLFIYFAELRKHNYSKWKFSALGLYDDLGPDKYDEKKFKKIVVDTITRVENEDPDACFHFAASIEYLVRETPAGGDGIKSYALLSLEYFDLLTNKYGHTIFNLVYQVIGTKLNADDKFTEIWFQLFIKCLKIETAYFEKEKEAGNLPKIYWYPSLYNSQTLETIYHKLGKDKFMEAAKILFSAPREIELNESSELVEIIRELSKDNSEAQKIIDYLIQKNTSKYWYLTKK